MNNTYFTMKFLCVCTVYGLKPAKSGLYTNEFQGNDDKRHHFTTFMLIKHLPHLFTYQLDKYLLHQ